MGYALSPQQAGSRLSMAPTSPITLVVLFSVFTLVVLLVLRDRLGALQLLTASVGAGILTLITKPHRKDSPRGGPAADRRVGLLLPERTFGFDSALYLTIAIIAGRYLQRPGTTAAIFLAVSVVLVMIGASRVPRRSLCDRRCERHFTRSALGAIARRILHTRW